MAVDYDNPDSILNVGDSLKKEKILKENQQKVAKLKEEYQKEQSAKPPVDFSFLKYKTAFFLLCILLVATGIRLYVASMPLTEQWAEQVVEENLRAQVSNRIAEQYPSLSDAAKGELVVQGTQQALASQQNQEAIANLEQEYKKSYQDTEENNYLYEIDPYYFYEVAQRQDLTWDKAAHTFLPLFENWWYTLLTACIPTISFVKAISYIPLLFTILSAACIFWITTKVWDETAGFVAALLFVSHPLLLEFSLIGFVDTNMLNIFFIVSTLLVWMYATAYLNQKKYVYAGVLTVVIISLIALFYYTWSAWYISPLLLIASVCCYGVLIFLKRLYLWNQQSKTTKYVLGGIILIIVSASILFFVNLNNFSDYLPNNVKVYLHMDYENPYGIWPDAFSLIKELQNNSFSATISYLGKLFAIISFCTFIYVVYKAIKAGFSTGVSPVVLQNETYRLENPEETGRPTRATKGSEHTIRSVTGGGRSSVDEENLNYVSLCVACIIFASLGFRAIRLLPYFIIFFAMFFGIGFSTCVDYISKKTKELFFPKEQVSILVATYSILFILCALPFVYPLATQIKEKSNIMPIMDDAIYDSAMYIKENSQNNAVISTWWDRGTFYKALAEREVHLQSAPHMPRTYWLSLFYTTNSPVEAKNIQMMLTCQNEFNFPTTLSRNLSKSDSLGLMRNFLSANTFEEQTEIINSSMINNNIKKYLISSLLSCNNKSPETYVVVIDDIMPRFSSVQYLAAWDYKTEQANLNYPYTDFEAGGCARTQSGVYCTINNANFYVNLTSVEWKGQLPVEEVFVVANNTVQHTVAENQTIQHTLIIYQRADQWKALYLPKQVADSMYLRLMLLDAYNAPEFEKVYDEVHTETSWVKVYKVIS
jgi:dolichyl-diphosphooligosaccharide--protein glycosyltransferase